MASVSMLCLTMVRGIVGKLTCFVFFLCNLGFLHLDFAYPILLTTRADTSLPKTTSQGAEPPIVKQPDQLELIVQSLQSIDRNLSEIREFIQLSTKELTKVINSQGRVSNIWKELIPLATAVVLAISLAINFLIFRKNYERTKYDYLANIWYDIRNIELANPDYVDSYKTENYTLFLNQGYQIFASILCGYLEDIYIAGFHKRDDFKPTFNRIKKLHYTWFGNNKEDFITKGFVDFIDQFKTS